MSKSFLIKAVLVISLWPILTFFLTLNFVGQEEEQEFTFTKTKEQMKVENQLFAVENYLNDKEFRNLEEYPLDDYLDDRELSNLEGFPSKPMSKEEARMCDENLHTTYKRGDAFFCPNDPTCISCFRANEVEKMKKVKDAFFSEENENHRAGLFARVFPVGKPVVLMAVNEGQMYLFMNWLCSCKENGIDPTEFTYMIPSDQRSYDMLSKLGFHVEPLAWKGQGDVKIQSTYDGGANIGGHSVINSVALFGVHSLVEKKYPVLYSDVDIVWFRNPLPFLFRASQQKDVLAMYSPWGGATGPINSGFIYIRPSFKSKIFMETLIDLTLIKKRSDQELWNKAIRHPKFRQLVFRSLPDHLFNLYFYTHEPPKITNETYVMHLLSVEKAPRAMEYGHWYFNKSCEVFDEGLDDSARAKRLYDWTRKLKIK